MDFSLFRESDYRALTSHHVSSFRCCLVSEGVTEVYRAEFVGILWLVFFADLCEKPQLAIALCACHSSQVPQKETGTPAMAAPATPNLPGRNFTEDSEGDTFAKDMATLEKDVARPCYFRIT